MGDKEMNKMLKTALATLALILAIENENVRFYWIIVCIYWCYNLYLEIKAEQVRKKVIRWFK